MKKITLSLCIILSTFLVNAQSTLKSLTYSADATFASGMFAPSISASKNFSLKKSRSTKFQVGLGARLTHYAGSKDLEYFTAPAILTSGKTGPSVFFADPIESNIDTFNYSKTAINSLNLDIILNYRISRKLSAEFNIDAIGFSFGGDKTGTLKNGAAANNTATAKPTSINALLISDNDRGSLNSQLVLIYKLNKSLALKGGAGFLFTEYTNSKNTVVNNAAALNDRFRNKSLGLVLGANYQFNNTKTKVITK